MPEIVRTITNTEFPKHQRSFLLDENDFGEVIKMPIKNTRKQRMKKKKYLSYCCRH